jgi:tRNA(Ile)-lysidine synthase
MNASLMVTAHQQDDQDETMVLKFLRGVHVSNFAGMSWAVDVQTATPGGKIPKKLLRPLLGVTKAELVEYLNERNQVWREDPTNASGE